MWWTWRTLGWIGQDTQRQTSETDTRTPGRWLASTTTQLPGVQTSWIPVTVPEPLLPWLAAATGSELRQGAAAAYRNRRHKLFAFHSEVREMTLNTPGR